MSEVLVLRSVGRAAPDRTARPPPPLLPVVPHELDRLSAQRLHGELGPADVWAYYYLCRQERKLLRETLLGPVSADRDGPAVALTGSVAFAKV